jgi:alpha-tubulin suppressor-like RCC1 family protein
MIPVACTLPRLAPVLAPALLVALVGCREDAESPTAPEPPPALDITPAAALSFRQVSAGGTHSCGVTTDNRAYCWGVGGGPLGDGTTTQRLTPVAVTGGLRFLHVSAGGSHTCGLTTENRAYCWGDNVFGQLGDGTITGRLRPVQVAGGLVFRQVRAGGGHTCGLTPDGRAYCWGINELGELGIGTNTGPASCSDFAFACSTNPVAVVTGLRFRQLSADDHTCGVTAESLAYCWGRVSQARSATARFHRVSRRSESPVVCYFASWTPARCTPVASPSPTGLTAGATMPGANSATVRPANASSRSQLPGAVSSVE